MVSHRTILAALLCVFGVVCAAAEDLSLGVWRYEFGPMNRYIEIVRVGDQWIQRSWLDNDESKLERKLTEGKPSPGHTMRFEVVDSTDRDACEIRDDRDLDLFDKDGFYRRARAEPAKSK